MRTVLLEPALARTKVLRALVRCRRVGRTRPPKRHLAHLRYNFLYWSSSPGRCMRVFSMRLLPSSPCIVARVRRLVQHHLFFTIIEEMPLEKLS